MIPGPKPIRKVLIANRGEIAARVIRTCRRLGIESILAASEADLDSIPARLADETVCIGPAQSAGSYLNVEAVVGAAVAAGADALHPGYGFLSENVKLARALREAGVIFIGPTEDQLQALGDKLRARQHALEAGLPVVPGAAVEDESQAVKLADEIGYPLLIKAVGGGGGRGMKQVHDHAAMAESMAMAVAEADAAFGDSRVYLERFVASGRHVEVQLLGDDENVIHLGDRDCSVQRRYQKLVEEAPAPNLADKLRSNMHAAAVALGEHLHYRGAGTVEFLVDCDRNEFYFLEMNARIQVEHPVTEMITGVDLVAEQIAVAEGRSLRLSQEQIAFHGHAMECRINAEDVGRDFQPCPGTVTRAVFPAGEGIRIDTHIENGSKVTPFYDSLLAKLIVAGTDRETVITNMAKALHNCRLEGVATNIAMHAALMEDAGFRKGGVDTAFFNDFIAGVRGVAAGGD
ncbi:MAG: acetyl-CoA carboxylase biotin carboxylase subunit [Gammaproteobacteria bacterium]|jgi:acetyl-CoA carboxylase biotin carboxylase subunit